MKWLLVTLFALVSTIAYADTDPLVHYPFNGNANDVIGNRDGEVHGATLVADRFGRENSAYYFDGSDDYIEIPNSTSWHFKYGFTLACWIRPEYPQTSIYAPIVGKHIHGYPNGYGLSFFGRDSLLYFHIEASFAFQTENQLESDWYFVVAKFDGKTGSLYLNGILISSNGSMALDTADNMTTVKIGSNATPGNPFYFKGEIDDIRVYDYSVSDETIRALYKEMPSPNVVELNLPEDNSLHTTSQIQLLWYESSPNVDKYWIDVAIDQNFNFKLMDSSIVVPYYVVRNLQSTKYWWRVRAHNGNGWGDFSEVRSFSVVVTDVGDGTSTPTEYNLSQNYPNPFNPSTDIQFTLPVASHVDVAVYNMLGERVDVLASDSYSVGTHTVRWDASSASSGTYIYRLVTPEFTATKRMTLIK